MRRRRAPLLCAGLVFLPLAGCGRNVPADTIRVLTYNIHAGRGLDGALDTERIARVILESDADLVALQEVDRRTARSDGRDLLAEIAERTGYAMAFGDNIPVQGGRYGNAILSRFPIASARNHPLPNVDEGEPRGVLIAEIDMPGGRVQFLATHFDHRPPDAARRASVATIDSLAAGTAILAGDLNATPESAALQRLAVAWQVAMTGPTFPADRPVRTIDYVAWRPADGWRATAITVLEEGVASDHRPVLVELRR